MNGVVSIGLSMRARLVFVSASCFGVLALSGCSDSDLADQSFRDMDRFLSLVQVIIIISVVMLLLFCAMKIKRVLSNKKVAEENHDHGEV